MQTYEYTWRNKFLTADSIDIDDMISNLDGAIGKLKQMRAAGVTLDHDGGTGEDYARLITTDESVAKQFGFECQ